MAYDAGLTPLAFTLWRAVIGATALAVLLALLYARGRDRVRWHALPRRTLAALVLAGCSSLVLNLAIFSAFQRTSIAVALLGLYTYPALVAAAAVVLGEERLTPRRGLALVLALAGMVVVVMGGEGGGGFDAVGFGLAVFAAAMQAAYFLLGRRGFRSIPSEEATFGAIGVMALGFMLVALLSGSGAAAALPIREPEVVPVLLWSGIAGGAIPATLFLVAIRSIGPTRTSIIALLEPVAGALLAALLLAEPLGPVQLVGGALILGAAALVQGGGEAAEPHEAPSGAT